MQQQEGFLAKRRTNPTTIGIVVAAHVAVLGAIMLAPPGMIPVPIVFTPLQIDTIKDPAPPPPPPVDPVRIAPRTSFTTSDPLVAHPPSDAGPQVVPLPPQPLTFDFPPIGIDPPKPVIAAPVMVEAKYDPRYADQLQPPYPTAMARAEIEGAVTVRVLVGTDGRVRQVQTLAATDPAFAEATEAQALRRWRFKPATKDGTPTETWLTMRLRFVLTS